MPSGQLSNCKKCGKVFVRYNGDLCPNCLKGIEEEYQRCVEYLHENKLVNIYDLSEGTEVSVAQITHFIREGRISIADNPNLGYPCDSCGTLITKGRLCGKCEVNLRKGIKRVNEENDRNSDNLERNVDNTYYEIGDRFYKK